MAWEWLLAAFAKIGQKLFRPKDQKSLIDNSARQTNVLSKVENTYIIHLPRTDEYLVGDYRSLPQPVVDAVREQLESRTDAARKRQEIRILRHDFSDEVTEFQSFLEREDAVLRRIRPFLEPQYASILRLADYAKTCYDHGERIKGDAIRNEVGLQYGRAGRKLCNLYIKGYVSDMFRHYLEPILGSEKDVGKIRERINGLIRKLILFSEHIYFIHRGSDVSAIAAEIREAVSDRAPYIALHAAGRPNVSRTIRIIQEVGLEFLDQNAYHLQQVPIGTGTVPFIDVSITRVEDTLDDDSRVALS
ncbi:MAG TPA: hypothetical protein VEH28_00400 [Thermoplasmata archaeon]|nr:hypothetical protein [Thermoplasmata archaeon]